MKDIIFDMINNAVEGVDVYENKGELWLIFTDEKEWVIKLTEDGDLYYNYYFFKNIFKYLTLDVDKNQRYITEWVKDTIKNGVKFTSFWGIFPEVESIIQNGVKSTSSYFGPHDHDVEDTIQKGIKLNKS